MGSRKLIKNWVKVALVLVIIAFLFANPFARAFIRFMLPLGSGMDDLIEIIALIILAALLVYKIKANWSRIKNWFRDDDYDF
jgi:hypothetical protein